MVGAQGPQNGFTAVEAPTVLEEIFGAEPAPQAQQQPPWAPRPQDQPPPTAPNGNVEGSWPDEALSPLEPPAQEPPATQDPLPQPPMPQVQQPPQDQPPGDAPTPSPLQDLFGPTDDNKQ
jgi:hypothetical protein